MPSPLRPSLVLCTLLGLLSVSTLVGQSDTQTQKLPFHGKLLSISPQTQAITIAGRAPRIFYLTPTTRITDGSGNPSNLGAAVIGEDVGGSYMKEAGGRKVLFSVRFGAKTTVTNPSTLMPASQPVSTPSPHQTASTMETAPATGAMAMSSPTSQKKRFAGKIVSASDSSLVVHGRSDQTFILNAGTKITNAAGNHATHVALKPGEHVTGTYIQSPDGTLTVQIVKITK